MTSLASRLGCLAGASVLLASAVPALAQTAADARCDSIVASKRADSVAAGLFVSIARVDGGTWLPAQAVGVLSAIGTSFAPPRPFRLTVFDGPGLSRALRSKADTAPVLRAPTLTGVYRFTATSLGDVHDIQTLRTSLMPGFDSASTAAIIDASQFKQLFRAPVDSMRLELRISTDSLPGARRMTSASFPRVPVTDARAAADNRPGEFPPDELAMGATFGEVLLRGVVGRSGMLLPETLEIVRGTSMAFARAALSAVPSQRFVPASVAGCTVAQRVDYPFTFILPDSSARPPRH